MAATVGVLYGGRLHAAALPIADAGADRGGGARPRNEPAAPARRAGRRRARRSSASRHAEEFADPLPQALALTAIVITFALTTFLLALGYRSYVLVGHDEVQDDVEDRRIARQKTPSAPLEDDETDDEDGEQERADDEVESGATGEPR